LKVVSAAMHVNVENLGPQTNIEELVNDQANINETLTDGEESVEPFDDIRHKKLETKKKSGVEVKNRR